jgi:hypothetical protein
MPLYNPRSTDVLSERVGNYQHPRSGGVLADHWVR